MYLENWIKQNGEKKANRESKETKRQKQVNLYLKLGKITTIEKGIKTILQKNDLRFLQSSSYKEYKVNALASEAEEGRDKLRKAAGSCK